MRKKIVLAVTVSESIEFFDSIIGGLMEQGFEIVVVSSPGKELDALKENKVKTIPLSMARRISVIKDITSLIRMIIVFIKERPYMVHSMTPKAGLLCMLASWICRVPKRVHTFTGLVWPTVKGLTKKILMLADSIICSCATHVIPEGQGVLLDLKTSGVCKKPMKVLGYGNVKGVDMEHFAPKRFSPAVLSEHRPFTYIFVGRIVGDKGINELVEAFQQLHSKYINTKLVLVGRYESDLDPVSDLTMERIKTNLSIEAVGAKYGDDLLQMYMDADCFVMPSYREGFPNTVMEAGAMGLPSIVTDINGSREIIVDGKNGLIVPPFSIEPLYEAMEKMLIDTAAREYMAGNARPMISSRFEKSFVQRCMLDFYKHIIE